MFWIVRRWPATTILVLLHALVIAGNLVAFYTSQDPERAFIWVYGFFASYPSSLLIRVIRPSDGVALAATLLLIGTLQWGIIGVAIDAIIHRARREAMPNI
jgi:hypothetical protein